MHQLLARSILLSILAVAASAGTAIGAVAPGPAFGPARVVAEYHVSELRRSPTVGSTITRSLHWRGPNRIRMHERIRSEFVAQSFVTDLAGPVMVLGNGTADGVRLPTRFTGVAPVAPDGLPLPWGDPMAPAWPLVVRMRSGEQVLREVRSAGRTVLRGTTDLAANDCAGYPAGTMTVDLDPRTLLPVRTIERRGSRVEWISTWRTLRPRAGDFGRLRLLDRGAVQRDGYVRRSPATVAATTPLDVALPAALPDGFRLSASGSATLGAALGPEASFPRSRGVFFARWSRGIEQLELTIRPARATLASDWDQSDPFGAECGAATERTVAVGPSTARFALGETGAARLWWRDGSTLYTLAGPFAAEQLAAIADSLRSVTA